MKKFDLGQAITILANLGVIAGIVFLAVELRQNNELLAAQSRAVRIGIRTGFASTMYSDPGIVEAITKEQAGGALTPADLHRLNWFAQETIDKFDYVYGEYLRGMIEAEDLAASSWRSTFYEGIPGMLDVWARIKTEYRPDFAEYIDEVVLNRD